MRPNPFSRAARTALAATSALMLCCLAGCGSSSSAPPQPSAAATPTCSPAAGSYSSPQTVTLADATPGATIFYTLDGSTPTASSARYTNPVPVASTETLHAIAVATGYTNSRVAAATYTIRIPGPIVSVVQTSDDGSQKFAAQPSFPFLSGTTASNPVYVDESLTYQTVEGFGAAFTDTAGYNLNVVASPAAHAEALNNLFTRSGNGIGLSFMRIPIAASDLSLSVYSFDDVLAGQTDPTLAHFSIAHDQAYILPLIQEAMGLNPQMKLMANPWSPPAWMKSNDSMVNGGSLLPANYSAFASYLVNYLQAYQHAGIPIDYLSIQNEPTYTTTYPSMDLEAPEATTVVSQYVLPALAANSISTRLLLFDSNYYLINYPLTELANLTIANSPQVAGVAWHGYGGQQGAMQLVANQFPNLGQYETEHSGQTYPGSPDQFKQDFEDITAVLRNSGRSFVKWSLAVNENYGPETNGCSNCDGIVTINSITGGVTYPRDYYSLGQFSKYIYPNAKRIYSSNAQGILTSAFLNPDSSKVLVAFNDSSAAQTFQVIWDGQSFAYTLPGLTAATFTWSGTQTDPVTVDAHTQIQASSYTSLSNLMTEDTTDANGGYDLGYASDGSWAQYKRVDFGSGVTQLSARVSTKDSGAAIEFHLDSPTGPLVATASVPDTSGWQTWTTVTAPATQATGLHDLCVVYRNLPSNLNWFSFN